MVTPCFSVSSFAAVSAPLRADTKTGLVVLFASASVNRDSRCYSLSWSLWLRFCAARLALPPLLLAGDGCAAPPHFPGRTTLRPLDLRQEADLSSSRIPRGRFMNKTQLLQGTLDLLIL